MVKNFLMVSCAMGRDVSFGEIHVTVGFNCRMETIQNAQCNIGVRKFLRTAAWLWKVMWYLCTCRCLHIGLHVCSGFGDNKK